jgi:hypothetical protein
MTKQEIIEVFIVRSAPSGRGELRRDLEQLSKDQLEQAYAVLQANQAVQAMEDELLRIQAEIAADRAMIELQMRQQREPQRLAEEKAQLEKDRETFKRATRRYGISDIEANFNVCRSILGLSFDEYSVGQIADSNAATLAPATPIEIQQWRQEAHEERVDYLMNQASPQELRQAARTEAEQRRIQFQRDQTESQIAARAKVDATQGYAPLPDRTSDGIKIDASFLKNLKADVYRNYLRRFGATAITARLNGR